MNSRVSFTVRQTSKIHITKTYKWTTSEKKTQTTQTHTTPFQWEQIGFLPHWWHAESINCSVIIYQLPLDLWTDVVIYLIAGLIAVEWKRNAETNDPLEHLAKSLSRKTNTNKCDWYIERPNWIQQGSAKELQTKLVNRHSFNILDDKRLFVYFCIAAIPLHSVISIRLNDERFPESLRMKEKNTHRKCSFQTIEYNSTAENVVNKLRIPQKQLSILWQRPWLNINKCDGNDDA